MNSVFQYNGNPVTFRNENGIIYVNATEMAKHFNKVPYEYLRLPTTIELINELTDTGKSRNGDNQLIITERGGIDGGGSWFHEDLALDYARWLSVKFRVWTNNRIKELLKNGYTKLDTITRKDLARMLYEAEEAKEKLEAENQKQTKALLEQAPKVLFADSVMASKQSVLVRDLAKILRQNGIKIGQNRLFAWLRSNGYLCQNGESHNQPTQRSMELAIFEIKKSVLNHPDGSVFVTETTKVTPKGQVYFVNKFLGRNAHAVSPISI